LVIVVVAMMLFLMTIPVSAVVTPPTTVKDALLKGIWGAIMDLQNQITTLTAKVNKIQSTPGPQGPIGPTGPKGDTGSIGTCSCVISGDEFNALKERVAALESIQTCSQTHYGVEICDRVDNDCDGLIDEEPLCCKDSDGDNVPDCIDPCPYNAFNTCVS